MLSGRLAAVSLLAECCPVHSTFLPFRQGGITVVDVPVWQFSAILL